MTAANGEVYLTKYVNPNTLATEIYLHINRKYLDREWKFELKDEEVVDKDEPDFEPLPPAVGEERVPAILYPRGKQFRRCPPCPGNNFEYFKREERLERKQTLNHILSCLAEAKCRRVKPRTASRDEKLIELC